MTLATRRVGVGEVRITRQARLNVIDVLNRHRLTYGLYSEEFERRVALLHGKRYACLVNSGTDALRIGLLAMKERFSWSNFNVILPALTFISSLNAVRQAGLAPRFVDIELDTYGIDPDQLRFNEQFDAAIMPVHLFGQPVKPEVITWARSMNLRIIDDSCETMFQRGCSDGDVSCFSTYACHVITSGVGGVAATSDPTLATLIRSFANHGRDSIYTSIDQALGNKQVMDGRFRFEREGYSSRLTEMEAAIGCAELDDWEQNIAKRRRIAGELVRQLSDLPLALPRVGGAHMMFPIRCEDAATRDRLVQHFESAQIETRPLLPLLSQPYVLKEYGDLRPQFPNATRAETTGFYVGSHPNMSMEDVARIVDAAHDFFR